MPYARRSRGLNARQLQYVKSVELHQRQNTPTSVAVTSSSSTSHFRTCTPPLVAQSQLARLVRVEPDASTTTTNERERARTDDEGTSPGTTSGRTLDDDDNQHVETDSSTTTRPRSQRSDSQSDFQIVQRGPRGTLILLSSSASAAAAAGGGANATTSSNSSTTEQGVPLTASRTSSLVVQLAKDDYEGRDDYSVKEGPGARRRDQDEEEEEEEEEWELLSYDEEDETTPAPP
ncbi:hypothetical protein JCM3766R1_002486 [Sporobolomyces carnicolor]